MRIEYKKIKYQVKGNQETGMVSGGNRQLPGTGKNASQGLRKRRELQHRHNHIVLVTLNGALQEYMIIRWWSSSSLNRDSADRMAGVVRASRSATRRHELTGKGDPML